MEAIASGFALIVSVAFFAVFVAPLVIEGTPAHPGFEMMDVFFLSILLVIFTFLIRLTIASVKADASGVRVRNVTNTRHYTWDEIDRFKFGAKHPSLLSAASVHTTDGKVHTIWAIQESNINALRKNPDMRARNMVTELNNMLQQHRELGLRDAERPLATPI